VPKDGDGMGWGQRTVVISWVSERTCPNAIARRALR
jgi:hypothetical protein